VWKIISLKGVLVTPRGLFHLSRKGLNPASQCVCEEQETSKVLSWRYLGKGLQEEAGRVEIRALMERKGLRQAFGQADGPVYLWQLLYLPPLMVPLTMYYGKLVRHIDSFE
jgi:hypothetical protein